MDKEELKKKIIEGHLSCVCHEIYKLRNKVDPDCVLHNYGDEIESIMDEYLNIATTQPTPDNGK